MEKIVRTPAELGEIAGQTRHALGLRQSDLNYFTRLNPRFIGEVEHGKETAQIGKVMKMLESMGLEMVIRTKPGKATANPHNLGLSKRRFWSSGDRLPVERIIARVLADPTERDLMTLKQRFGVGPILMTWQKLIQRGDIAQSVIPIAKKMLRKLIAFT